MIHDDTQVHRINFNLFQLCHDLDGECWRILVQRCLQILMDTRGPEIRTGTFEVECGGKLQRGESRGQKFAIRMKSEFAKLNFQHRFSIRR